MSNFSDYIKLFINDFECPVCYSTENDIYTTKCGHVICDKCISKLIDTNKCYNCRQELTLKKYILFSCLLYFFVNC